ncbi:hypothetical protein OCHUTO_0645 [Orientia chuto str. Dubai]|uniref:Transposase n=1 Tax=Orientia chuto str. Dubai TaxID=1359168 RepID=A0A0F3MJR0_9RICK|nr:hypothetical protein [Candidatus Orientia mediorientalis]KJV56013.1 hypothetical protein OCHUTO_0645 [Orientia chuto str. Dubai]
MCCFIADRAMFSKANLQILDEGGYRYIVAAKLKTLKKEKKEEILSEKNYKLAVIGNDFTLLMSQGSFVNNMNWF